MIDLLEQHGQTQGLASMMAVWMMGRPHWSDDALGFYPVKERLIEGAIRDDESAAFLVDVGGSQGNDLTKFLDHHPYDSFPGQLVLHDLNQVITSIPDKRLSPGIRAEVYDFFGGPESVKGEHSKKCQHCSSISQNILSHISPRGIGH